LTLTRLEAREELGKRSAIERFFGRVFLFFHLQRPPLCGWSEIASQAALTYAASVIVEQLKGSLLICGKEIPSGEMPSFTRLYSGWCRREGKSFYPGIDL
jgi:hypothetical protein